MGSHGSLVAHPSYYFCPTHKGGNDPGDGEVIVDVLADGKDRSPYNGKKLTVKIPEEVGQEDLSRSTREVNLYELFKEWQTAPIEERSQEIARTFTWFGNSYLPGIDQFEMTIGSWGNVENWNYDVNQD